MGKKKRHMFAAKFKHLRERWERAKERDAAKEPSLEPIEEKFIEPEEKPKIVEVEKSKTYSQKESDSKDKSEGEENSS